MILPYRFRKCVLCLDKPAHSKEHLIPQSVGGRLEAYLLCSDCNNHFGSEFVSALREDQSIRMAAENLKHQLPKRLYENMTRGLPLLGREEGGLPVRAYRKNGKLHVIPGKAPGGPRVQDFKGARSEISKRLDKIGCPEAKKNQFLDAFEKVPEGQPFIIPGWQFVKHPMPDLYPDSSRVRVDERVPALVAYDYLGLLLADRIYDPSFDTLRRYIRTGEKSDRHDVRRLAFNDYEPAHMIDIERGGSDFSVNVCFFGWLVFEVRFKNSVWRGPDPVYREDLTVGGCFVAKSRSDAKKGIWYELGRSDSGASQ